MYILLVFLYACRALKLNSVGYDFYIFIPAEPYPNPVLQIKPQLNLTLPKIK